jgi:O-antigen/teichoic acid export membrane protein
MFLKNSVTTFVTQILMFLLAFASNVLITRVLGPSGKGQVALLTSFVGFLSLGSGLGVGAASIYQLNREKALQPIVASSALWLQFVLALTAMMATLGVAGWLVDAIFIGQVPHALVVIGIVISLPMVTFSGAVSNLLIGLHAIKKYSAIQIVNGLVQFVSFIVLLICVQTTVASVVVVMALAALCSAALGLYWLNRLLPEMRLRLSFEQVRSLISYGSRAWIGNILQFFNYRLDVYIVNIFIGPSGVGIYSVAVALAETIWYIPAAVSTVLFPRTASDWDLATEFTPRVARNVAFITLLAALLLGIMGFPLIRLIYGMQFISATLPLVVLLPGIVFLSIGKILASDLAGRNKPHYGTLSAIVALTATVILDFVLIPSLGIVGAALASTISYGLSTLVLLYLYLRLSGNTLCSVLFIRTSDLRQYADLAIRYTARWRAVLVNH